MPTDEVEIIEVIERGERAYHLKPTNGKYRHYQVEKIPIALFQAYAMHRDLFLYSRGLIQKYFRPLREKPMHICKNHPEGHQCPYDE